MFVDADDILTPWLLESGVAVIEKEKCDVIIGKIKTTNERPNGFPVRSSNIAFELLDSDYKREELECHIFAKTCKRWQRDVDGWEFNGEGCWAHLLKKEVAQTICFMKGVSVGEDTIWALSILNNPRHYRIGMLSERWYYYIQNEYSVLNKYNPKIVEQLTTPVKILDKKYGNKTGNIYAAYTDWILMKLKQICYRAYLAEENRNPICEKVADLSTVLSNDPWKSVLGRGKRQPLKKRIKFILYERNIILYLYVIVRKFRNKKASSVGDNNEN